MKYLGKYYCKKDFVAIFDFTKANGLILYSGKLLKLDG